ncbi:MAG: AI-2E family transporter [Bacteroidota bacterium]
MKNKILEAVFVITAIVLVLYFLYEIRQILIYLIISGIIAIVGRPVADFISKVKIGKYQIPVVLSAVITIITFLSIILLLGAALVPLINEQAHSLSLLNLEEVEKNISVGREYISNWLTSLGIDNMEVFGNKQIEDIIDFSFIPNFLNSIVETMGGLSVGLLIISFITFFLLKDKELMKKSVLALVPDSKTGQASKLMSTVKLSLSRYLFGLIIQVSIMFTLYTLMLYIAGINNFLIIAVLGALLNLIPYVGPLIAFVLMILLSITGNITEEFNEVILPMITKITIGYVIIQLIDNFVNQPVIFSKTAHAHPLEIFLVILIAGDLGGIIGMIVAVPSYTLLRIILKEFFSEFKIVKSLTKNL